MSFYRKTGMVDVQECAVDSTSVIAIGDLVQTDESAGDLIPGATNVAVKGIALKASASGSTTAIPVDVLHPGDRVIASVEAGTPASTHNGKFADINSQDGITLTASNNDVRVFYTGSATEIECELLNLETNG